MSTPDVRPVGDLPNEIGKTAARELSLNGITSLKKDLESQLVALEKQFWTGGAEFYREGKEGLYSAVVSSTYVRDGGVWRLGFHQQTPAPGA